jgi:hypothetical protein
MRHWHSFVMKNLIKGTLAGAVIVFIWGAFSWMALPFHMMTIGGVANEDAVMAAVGAGAEKGGTYLVPNPHSEVIQGMPEAERQAAMEAGMERMKKGPWVFMAVTKDIHDPEAMGPQMAVNFATNLAAAFLLTWILTLLPAGAGVGKRAGVAAAIALFAGIFIHGNYWNWFGFGCGYTLYQILDGVIAWGLAGLAIGKLTKA